MTQVAMSNLITIFINNRNLLTWPRAMAEYLRDLPRTRIVFVDNDSTYPPLLKYYESSGLEVIRLPKNMGQNAPWESGAVERLAGEYYVVTDPDLDLSSIPKDVLDVLLRGVCDHRASKCGLSLEIDDLPADSLVGGDAREWEKRFWARRLNDEYFDAEIDTTFALYRKGVHGGGRQLRANRPYTAKHLPWYVTPTTITEEYRFYLKTASAVSSWGTRIKSRDHEVDVIRGTRYVTFSFDDGDLATAKEVDHILEPDRATFYIVTGWIRPRAIPISDSLNVNIDHGTVQDWCALAHRNHDIGSHTVSHISAEDPRATQEYEASLNFIKQFGPGPYSLSFPWHKKGPVEAPYDSIRCGNSIRWNSLDNMNLREIGSWTIRPDELDEILRQLTHDVPPDSWVVFCLHGLDGRLAISWPQDSFKRLVSAVRAIGYKIRTVAEMSRILNQSSTTKGCCPRCGDLDNLKQATLYTTDWSDSSNPTTPLTHDLKAIIEFLELRDLAGRIILDVGVGASHLARRLSSKVTAIDGITVVGNEQIKGLSLQLDNYRVFLLNKYGNRLRALGGTYNIIVDNNPTSFTNCIQCAGRIFETYFSLLAPNGYVVTHLDGLRWAARQLFPDALSLSLTELNELVGSLGLRATDVNHGVVVVARQSEWESALENMSPHALTQEIPKKRDNWFVNYQQIPDKGIDGYRRISDRVKFFVSKDFQGASILDIGCNTGQMCFQAIAWGASSAVGIDYDRAAISKARALIKQENVMFSCEDIETPACWRTIAPADIVLFLAVYLTKELDNKEAILSKVASKARKVLYLEGHENDSQNYTSDRYVSDLTRFTDFDNVEYLGRLDGLGARPFFRCWRGALTAAEAIDKLLEIIKDARFHRIVVVGKSASGKSTLCEQLRQRELDSYVLYDDVTPPYKAERFVLFDWRGLEYVPDADAVFIIICNENERIRRIRESSPHKDTLLRSSPGQISGASAVYTVRSDGMTCL